MKFVQVICTDKNMPSQSEIEALQDLLFDPKQYRVAFQENAEGTEEGEIFEILREQILRYAKSTPEFKDFLINNLTETTSSGSRKPQTHSFSPRMRTSMMFSPRSSSRPTVD